jgi:3-polyprenyl-4-hydroxybenzoate decarboxylase
VERDEGFIHKIRIRLLPRTPYSNAYNVIVIALQIAVSLRILHHAYKELFCQLYTLFFSFVLRLTSKLAASTKVPVKSIALIPSSTKTLPALAKGVAQTAQYNIYSFTYKFI